MPSENKTPNYGLNQWQGNEYPKREDFNGDNAKIDEALSKKQNSEDAFSGNYNDLEDIPESYPPSPHTHPYIPTSEKNKANGVAGLNKDGKMFKEQLPGMDFYTKDEMLTNATRSSLGLSSNSVPNDAFLKLALGNFKYAYVITVKTNTGRIISGLTVNGATDRFGNPLITDENGICVALSNSSSVTLSISSDFIDLESKTMTVNSKDTVTLADFIVTSVAENTVIIIDKSKSIKFTSPVTADIHLIGAGYNGSSGTDDNDGGRGGNSGKQYYRTNIHISTGSYQAIIGASSGANSSFLGYSSSNGTNEQGGIGGTNSLNNGGGGRNSTIKLFGTGAIVGGGSGGGGSSQFNAMAGIPGRGGSPYGGGGGKSGSQTYDAKSGENATGYGGGGGGGGGAEHSPSPPGHGGRGYQGAIFVKWRYD